MDAEKKWQDARAILNSDPSKEDFDTAIQLLNDAIASGHACAYHTLGQVYYRGYSEYMLERDIDKAYELCNKSLELGNEQAKLSLAYMYINGHVVEKDVKKAEELLVSLADKDDADACEMLGRLALAHPETTLTPEEGWKWIEKGASLGHDDCSLYIARRTRDEGRYEEAFAIFKDLSEKGHRQAYGDFGEALYYGAGCEKDAKEAVHWLTLSAEDDNARSLCLLGNRYLDGQGVDHPDRDKGIELLTRSAELGYALAMQNLGAIYGNYLEEEKSAYWFDKAIEAGMQESVEMKKSYSPDTFVARLDSLVRSYIRTGEIEKAVSLVADYYSNGDHRVLPIYINILTRGIGEKEFGRDDRKAFEILSEEVKRKDNYSRYMLAQFYEHGITVEADPAKAFGLMMQAAESDYTSAQKFVSDCYREGYLIESDNEKALHWMKKAADKGDSEAEIILAQSYLNDSDIHTITSDNIEVEKNEELGLSYLAKAVEHNNARALYIMSKCYEVGKYFEKDDKKRYESLEKSVEIEQDPRVVCALGVCLKDGIGTDADYERAFHCFEFAVENGNGSAYYYLAEMYRNGLYVEKDEAKASECSAKWGDSIHSLLSGVMPIDQVREEANLGNPEAMYQLGKRYQQGDCVEQNMEIASDWWLKAAMKGHAAACNDLGVFYFFTKHEVENGLKWLKKSADQGYPISLRVLGDIYRHGWGVEKDVEQGIKLLKTAAEQDDEFAMNTLAGIYHDAEDVEQDYGQAKYWLERYYASGNGDAYFRMGRCLYYGDMYDKDYLKALENFEKALKEGCYDAAGFYIDMLWLGRNAQKDQKRVLSLFKELADSNDSVAQHYLYRLYNSEDNEKPEPDLAIEYLKKSAEAGYAVAQREMGFGYQDENVFGIDYQKANEWFEKAVENGDVIAYVNLAISYQNGRGVEKDIKKAFEMYCIAAEHKDSYAANEAARMLLVGEEGVTDIDVDRAIALLEPVAEQNDHSSFLLGFALNVKNDQENSYSWERAEKATLCLYHAAQKDHPEAMYRLAYSFMEGRGVMRDKEQATHWFEEAVKHECRVEEIKKILEDYLSGDESAEKYPQWVYWHGIIESNPLLIQEKEA